MVAIGVGAAQQPISAPLLLAAVLGVAVAVGLPGVFAAGDVRHRSVKRVASAGGEGAIAVQRHPPLPRRGGRLTRSHSETWVGCIVCSATVSSSAVSVSRSICSRRRALKAATVWVVS